MLKLKNERFVVGIYESHLGVAFSLVRYVYGFRTFKDAQTWAENYKHQTQIAKVM